MPWLDYSADEVARFHPAFAALANQALKIIKLDDTYEWVHHVRTPGNTLVPDFVLRHRHGKQWVLTLEIKRKKEAVYSTRNQFQAQSYASQNQQLYAPTAPRYFSISNLEITILASLNGDRPPRECRLYEGVFESGDFRSIPETIHKQQLIKDLVRLLRIVTSDQAPIFDTIWPAILEDFISYSGSLPASEQLNITEPNTPNWRLVQDFFAASTPQDSIRIFFLRCLMAEYLRGTLLKHGHHQAQKIPPANASLKSIAGTIAALQHIDFSKLFEAESPDLYRNLKVQDPVGRGLIVKYLRSITDPTRKVVDLAQSRIDSLELLDSVMTSLYPIEMQNQCGKVQTDPELAAILARLTILTLDSAFVLDPCCGDGILLSAAYDLLTDLGVSYKSALKKLCGIEADPIATRLTEVRLALKQPASLSPDPTVRIYHGDLFAHAQVVARADVILMNPPFLRYEEQQGRYVPPALRTHYGNAIREVDGQIPVTTKGQPNLYNYYVEFVVKAADPNTLIGIILDNKWYHSKYGEELRKFLLEHCEIKGIVEYPHSSFFTSWTIATSIVIARKVPVVRPDHVVKFVRAKADPRGTSLRELAGAFHRNEEWPTDWTCGLVPQECLRADVGWKSNFSNTLKNNYRLPAWPTLDDLFMNSRRGSLEKEGGGTAVFEFPFNRSDYGPIRMAKPNGKSFQTNKGKHLTSEENARLRDLASQIPTSYRGQALRNSDDPDHYDLTQEDVQKQQTLEPPILRNRNLYQQLFFYDRSEWTTHHDAALGAMRSHPQVQVYIRGVETIVNLTTDVLPKESLWIALREPIAGELIIPRKTRKGHWVHINPFAFDLRRPQVRISSNFLSYSGCTAVNDASGLTREMATRLIAAFLVSSFGQLQFEMEGYNREGLLAVEKHHFHRIKIFDPRWVRLERRRLILEAFGNLPYKIETNKYSWEQHERNALDKLFAEEIVVRCNKFDRRELLEEVHMALDEWLMARQP